MSSNPVRRFSASARMVVAIGEVLLSRPPREADQIQLGERLVVAGLRLNQPGDPPRLVGQLALHEFSVRDVQYLRQIWLGRPFTLAGDDPLRPPERIEE